MYTAATVQKRERRSQSPRETLGKSQGQKEELILSAQVDAPGSNECIFQTRQSAGGLSTPQKFAGPSSSTPCNHETLSRSRIANTTRPFLLAPFATRFIITGVPSFSRSRAIKAQPCALTSAVWHSERKSHAGSRLVTTTGIFSGRRVLRLRSRNPILFNPTFLLGTFSQFHPYECSLWPASTRRLLVTNRQPHLELGYY